MLADQNFVGCAEDTGIVLLEHSPPAGIGARLKNHHQSIVRPGHSQGIQGLADRGGMMGKIIDHGDAANHAANLLPPLDPFKGGQPFDNGTKGKTKMAEQGDYR